jgi:hypothetical protein
MRHSTYATLVVSISDLLMGRAPGCYQHRRGHLFMTPELYREMGLMSRYYHDNIMIWVRA